MTVLKAVRGKIQTLPQCETRQKTRPAQLPSIQDNKPLILHWNHTSLGGLVDNPLDFGPVDRGSNPTTDITFHSFQLSIINGPMWHHTHETTPAWWNRIPMAQGGTNTKRTFYTMWHNAPWIWDYITSKGWQEPSNRTKVKDTCWCVQTRIC